MELGESAVHSGVEEGGPGVRASARGDVGSARSNDVARRAPPDVPSSHDVRELAVGSVLPPAIHGGGGCLGGVRPCAGSSDVWVYNASSVPSMKAPRSPRSPIASLRERSVFFCRKIHPPT